MFPAMHDTRISADCHIDLPWIPPDLFTSRRSAVLRDRMPCVTDGPYIEEQFPHLPKDVTRKITCENAGTFYRSM